MTPKSNSLLRILACAGALALGAVAARSAVVPGPAASAAVDLAPYRTVLHVDQAHGDDIKGTGAQEKPFASVTKALEAAGRPTAQARVAVLVSQGRYVQPTFALKPHVDLFGGFAAPGGARDVAAYASVLDGEENGRIVLGADDARLDGFYLVNGRVRGKGAALLCDGTSPTIANCVFTRNRTLVPVPWNPPLLHETANDGGAIMCLNDAAPRIEHNMFYGNSTECGRGAALAIDHSSPVVAANVFANNRAGLEDPMRSSDGGAVTFFRWSQGTFADNVVVANESLTRNDAGGLWVALWSAPRISRNVFVANEGGDDAGALFIGGQEHRYDAPLDAYPPADKFKVVIEDNRFIGNTNSTKNSGAMRVTMETRAEFRNNLIAENVGGFYLQRSEITAENNTVWQDWRFLENKPTLGQSHFAGNILKGPADSVEANIAWGKNMAEATVPGGPHQAVADIFENDGLNGELTDLHFDAVTCTTTVTTKAPLPAGPDLAGRAINVSDSNGGKRGQWGGQWRVVARASGREIVLWGRLDAVTHAPKFFAILRTFTPKADAPAGLGAHPAR